MSMKRRKKKRKLKKHVKKVLLILLFILVLVLCAVFLFSKKVTRIILKSNNVYLASNTTEVMLYKENEGKKIIEDKKVPRGIIVQTFNKKIEADDITYQIIYIDGEKFLVDKDSITKDEKNTVLEKVIYDRTPTYILESLESRKINGLADKGSELEVIDFDKLKDDGSVNIYHIKQGETEGYVYGKYTTFTKEEAEKHYDEELYNNVYSQVTNPYNGGEASKLDFYPTDKREFSDNKMPEAVYSLYLNSGSNVIDSIDEYIEFAKDTKINAFVVDIKDNETPAYPAKTFESLSKSNYDHAINSYDDYKNAIKKLKDAGFYVIGRITTFKDSYYVQDNPGDAISSKDSGNPYLHDGSYWPSAYDRDVWYYTVSLAKEAVTEFGFNEINFDYVRFPDRMQNKDPYVDFKNTYNEDKCQAIQRFVQYATDELHNLNVYVSIDVFGESTNGTYMTAYGQYWPALSNIADVMSGMPYPDHFSNYYYGIYQPWNNPYKLMYNWALDGSKRQKETPNPAKARTWIQAYDVMRYVDPNGISYNANELKQEITGLYDGGFKDGYITWLSNSNLSKYRQQKAAFQVDYWKEYNE